MDLLLAFRLQLSQHIVEASQTREFVPDSRIEYWDGYIEGLHWVLRTIGEVEAAGAIEQAIKDLPEAEGFAD